MNSIGEYDHLLNRFQWHQQYPEYDFEVKTRYYLVEQQICLLVFLDNTIQFTKIQLARNANIFDYQQIIGRRLFNTVLDETYFYCW